MVRRMRHKGAFITILMVACMLACQIGVYAEEYTPLLRVSTNDVYLTAGEENEIEITLKNTGDFDVYEVKAVLSVPATTAGISIIDGAHKIFNEIRDGKEKTYNPILYVARDLPLGAYTLNLQLDYRKTYRMGTPLYESASVQIGVAVWNVTKSKARLDIGMDGLKVDAGSEQEISIRIENIGEEKIYDIDSTITSTSPYIAVTKGARFTEDVLEIGDGFTFNPTLAVAKNAPLGVYTLTASASYLDVDGREYHETYTLGFTVGSVQVPAQTSVVLRRYWTTPETIRPGDIFDLELELECLGAKSHDVKTSLSLDFSTGIVSLSPTLVSAGDIEPGQQEEVVYELLAGGEVEAGQYPAVLTITYLDVDGVPASLVETLTLSVRGIVEFNLVNLDPISAKEGATTEFEADLLLIGTESVQFVTIEIFEDSTFRRTLESEEYIGAVDPDSPIPFDLAFEVEKGSEAGDHILTLKLTYTDDLNQEHEKTIDLPVTVTEAQSDTETKKGSLWGFWLLLRRLLGLMP